jgi:dimethylargininase
MFRHAIVRRPGPNFADGVTTSGLGAPEFEVALAQHEAYCAALRRCGLELIVLEADSRYPDGCFVEDAAVVTPCGAILTRPGAPSRQGEAGAFRDTLARFFPGHAAIASPGTLEGGDICEADGHYLIGVSERTNEEGARQLAEWLAGLGYTSACVDIRGRRDILHLKSGIAYLGEPPHGAGAGGTLVVWEALADHPALAGYHLIRVPPAESYAANCVRVNEHVLLPAGYPGVQAALADAGYDVIALEVSEYRKMDGGLSCLSVRF